MLSRLRGTRNGEDPLELAVVGVGNIGAVHLRSARAMPNVTVTAVADVDADRRDWATEVGVSRTYEDAADLFESESPDAAVVAVPPFLHEEVVAMAADAGVDVFVEKPLARSTEEARGLLDLAESAGIAVGVDHTLRYQPDVVAVNERFANGAVGHVPYATMTRLNDGALGGPPITRAPPAWQLDPAAAGGGALLELGVHCFDVLEWIFGPLEVADVYLERTLDLDAEDGATVVLESAERGTTVVCHCGTYQWERLPAVNTRLRLEGVAGTVDNTNYLPRNFYASAARSALENVTNRVLGRPPTVFGPTYHLQAHYRALEDFVMARLAGNRPPVDGQAGLRAVSLVEEAIEQAGETEEQAPVPEVTS